MQNNLFKDMWPGAEVNVHAGRRCDALKRGTT